MVKSSLDVKCLIRSLRSHKLVLREVNALDSVTEKHTNSTQEIFLEFLFGEAIA